MAKRSAAVIGVNKYFDPTIPELKGAENDAKEFHQRLTDDAAGEFKFEVAPHHFLIGNDAKCDRLRQAISDLLWKTEEADLCLFYFAGHGFTDKYGNGYLAPWDIKREEPLVRGIRMQELNDLMLAAKQKKAVLLILDCCYSGIAAQGEVERGEAVVEEPHVEQWFPALKEEREGEGRIVFASAGKNQKSRELSSCDHMLSAAGQPPHAHGAFTYNLIEGLDGKAASGAAATVTLFELMNYVESQMKGPDQRPTWYGSGVRDAPSIVMGRASRWSSIDAEMRKANELFARDDPNSVLFAVKKVSDVMQRYAAFPEATALKKRLDGKLSAYRAPLLKWVQYNREELLDFADVLDELNKVAGRLDFDTFVQQKRQMRGLLIHFCKIVSTTAADLPCTDADRDQIKTYYSEQTQESAVAKTEGLTQGTVKAGSIE